MCRIEIPMEAGARMYCAAGSAGSSQATPTVITRAEQGARANAHGCHVSCSEQHEPRQPRSWLILTVRQKLRQVTLQCNPTWSEGWVAARAVERSVFSIV